MTNPEEIKPMPPLHLHDAAYDAVRRPLFDEPPRINVKVAMSRWARFEDRRCNDIGLNRAYGGKA